MVAASHQGRQDAASTRAGRTPPGPARGATGVDRRTATVLHLQRAAGNRAVSERLAPERAGARQRSAPEAEVPVVQRHSSWEHALLGDTLPGQLPSRDVPNETKTHVLEREAARMRFFQTDPRGNPTAEFPDVRWMQLRGSQLWLSNGELNALGDYLPDPTTIDTMTAEQLIPVLQRMRQVILGDASAAIGRSGGKMEGAASGSWLPGAAGEVRDLDAATAQLGTNRYAGLLSRNACHFAPFSWQRWALFHSEAIEEAQLHHASRSALTPLNAVDTSVEEHQRQALLKNGYADHFIQDSFAAGHLINKTLVMQWFVDYLNGLNWLDRPWVGMPSKAVMSRMGSAQQPGVAGQDRYGRAPADMPSWADQSFGENAIDPQSGQERDSREGRVAASGVSGTGAEQEANYQAYLEFLNSAFLNMAAAGIHDYFNERGLTVLNDYGEMRVGGDMTLISESDALGAQWASQAAYLSRQAIDDTLLTGTTSHTVEEIWSYVPQKVRISFISGRSEDYTLADFQDAVVHEICLEQIFPDLVGSFKGLVVRTAGSELVEGGMSQDSGTAPTPPVQGPKGDFPVPSGSSNVG